MSESTASQDEIEQGFGKVAAGMSRADLPQTPKVNREPN